MIKLLVTLSSPSAKYVIRQIFWRPAIPSLGDEMTFCEGLYSASVDAVVHPMQSDEIHIDGSVRDDELDELAKEDGWSRH